ncbi:MAG TPA: cob(I)yrinic acid a,c-diamide adenosyltransferase [Usitatibacter sp.]|nr:cob(I)yrinic acid a,c-diamide adenosyltransferase [Usitatibacter sp.]
MANRLTRIVTRTGDDGTTGLGDGTRVGKDALRIQAMGDVDELNSAIGCALAESVPERLAAALGAVQNDLFDLGGEICIPGRVALQAAHIEALDAAIASLNADLPPLREFVLPGGERAAALCHLARTVCRRAERTLVALSRSEAVAPTSLQYLNRLSDLLFVAARVVNRAAGRPETLWKPGDAVKAG